MPLRIWALAAIVAGCSSSEPARARGQIVVALTIDWEGAYLSPDGLDALDALRHDVGGAPITHFVSAAYFTKDHPDSTTVMSLASAIHPGDELAVHLHGWRSLARASGVPPKLSPSFLSGTDKLLEFEDGDAGFDTDLDVYEVPELRALLRTSRRLLEKLGPVSKTFRAGGYLGTPKVLQAIFEEGYTVDSSATDHRQLDEQKDAVLPERIHEIWPNVETMTQPFPVDVTGGQLLELPITGIADYVTVAEIAGLFDAARARLQANPDRDVLVVLGFHQETAHEFAGRIVDALGPARAVGDVVFVTMEQAADRW